MSKIRANTQIIPGTVSRALADAALTAELNKFGTDITALSTDKANITYVDQKISDLIGGAPEALDTLNELSAALNDSADFGATVTQSLTDHGTRLTNIEGDVSIVKEADLVRGEVPTGTIDGTNTVFALARQPRPGSVMVFKNGVADFSPDITVDEAGMTVTFATAPATGDKVHVCYEAVRAA